VAGLAPTFGRGAMTNNRVDIKNANVILVMGGNPAEAHPCGFKWAIEAKVKNRARLIVVDSRFTRTAAVADIYAQLRPGTDIAFLGGVINYLLSNDKILHEYVRTYTNASFLVREDYRFEEGLFSGYNAEKRSYDKTSWAYELDGDGYARIDPTMQNPRCVLQLMKRHYAPYTPEMVASLTGVPRERFLKICETIATTATPDRTMTSMYALGWTQHTVGSQNVRAMACIQMLLGNIGMPGGGVNALRGHSNIRGLTDLGVMSHLLPGYLGIPVEAEPDLKTHLEKHTPKPLRPGQMNCWQNYPKFMVSLLKAWYGAAATKENDFAYDFLPKNDKVYDILQVFQLMWQGKVNGYFCQGFNPLGSVPDKDKLIQSLSKLKFLVIIDPLGTETSNFWQNRGDFNNVDPKQIQTEVFRLPSTCFAEEDGSLVNSSRWLQWHFKGAEPPGEARGDVEIIGDPFVRIRTLYAKEGGAFPDPILKLTWPYKIPHAPAAEELAREYNGHARPRTNWIWR
jgi:formate dehydrogenase major subunit